MRRRCGFSQVPIEAWSLAEDSASDQPAEGENDRVHPRFQQTARDCTIRQPGVTLRLAPAALLDELGDETCPSRLVTCPYSLPRIALKVFVKECPVAPSGVLLKLLAMAVHGP